MIGPVSKHSTLLLVVACSLCVTPVVVRAQTPDADPKDTTGLDQSVLSDGGIGSLEIATDVPGAQVRVDGEAAGTTPLTVGAIRSGVHQVEVTAPGQAPVTRTVTIKDGTSAVIYLQVSSGSVATPSVTPNPEPKPSVVDASREFGLSILGLPWSALAVGATFGLFLMAAVFLTTQPADAPLLADAEVDISKQTWRALGLTSLVMGALSAVVAGVILFFQLEPMERLVDVARAAMGKGPRSSDSR